MRFVFLALFVAVSIFHLAASFFNKPKLRNASIAFIVLFLLLYYVFSAERKSTVLLVALITSLLGDIILIPPGFAFFAVGGLSFIVSQVCYIIEYTKHIDFSAVSVFASVCFFALYFTAAFFAFKKLCTSMDKLTFIGTVLYLALNAVMNLFAFFLLWTKPSFGSSLVLFGAMSFYLSDILLFFNNFYKGGLKGKYFSVMLTYIIAQFCITQGILLTAA